ncbi:hypothetical protein PENSPDRAFT_659771 [Peniophora sp. CONT]|nr:hypothetical protein PENSPDRAFT_659771 [Peniophora sp. CONT]
MALGLLSLRYFIYLNLARPSTVLVFLASRRLQSYSSSSNTSTSNVGPNGIEHAQTRRPQKLRHTPRLMLHNEKNGH